MGLQPQRLSRWSQLASSDVPEGGAKRIVLSSVGKTANWI